ncbi:helix-turn-helix domain-containing protein [Roseomonas nepalensis]|uniref:Helix-turn-helix domain-containing protein n=1 Tax=Muricoccus nepalensis TaxID=1854500 RepID=A0A502F9I1_9PROT|nr:helix-turn-helix domain-containing protein [Roseomonas nepalensis]TPG45983.1 helix-turn-helix domain-containing protein [Roseomonas nepalensis]
MTPQELKAARNAVGLSAEGFARLVRVESGRTVRRWESGEREIPGPVVVLVEALMASRAVRQFFGLVVEGDLTLAAPVHSEKKGI